jgi:hypothetical protein
LPTRRARATAIRLIASTDRPADHQRGQPHQRRHPQQRLRERLALHLHPLVQVTQLLQVVVACGNGHQVAVVPQLQFIDQPLQRHQVAIGLPPQRGCFAECTDVARIAEREHQAWDIGARVAALQEALPGLFLVRFGLFQRQPRLQIAQRHLQGLARVVQVLGIATRQVAAQRGGGILLATRPVALAGDPGSRGRLQFLDQGGQRDQSDRHARQQRKSQSQPPGHRHPPALLVRATPTHPGSPECAAVTTSLEPAQPRTGNVWAMRKRGRRGLSRFRHKRMACQIRLNPLRPFLSASPGLAVVWTAAGAA